jgi:A nuclease family of the HNH/ENDO VII superfamily with conserved AHH
LWAVIANDNIETAANYLERTMASAMPTIIGFLANQIGLRGLGRRIGEMIERVRELVDQGLTWLVNKLVTMGRGLLEMGRRALGGGADAENPALAPMIQDIHTTETPLVTNGKMSHEEANRVASSVAGRHQNVVRSINVVERAGRWDYDYVQRAAIEGKPKEEGESNNRATIAPLLNKVAPNTPPEGYEYYDHADDGSFKIRRLRGNANDNFIKLSIISENTTSTGEDGQSGVENKLIESPEEGGSKRLSTPGRLARNVGGSPKNHQFHHIIPDAVVRTNQLMILTREKTGYDLDRQSNGIRMPCNDEGKAETNLPIHRGSHPAYNSRVNTELNTRLEQIMEGNDYDNANMIDSPFLLSAAIASENQFRTIASGLFPKLT